MDGGGDLIQSEGFQALPERKRNHKLGNTRTFRYVKSQSTAKIILAPDHMGSVHDASVTPGGKLDNQGPCLSNLLTHIMHVVT